MPAMLPTLPRHRGARGCVRYGFGAVIDALPGFLIVANALGANPRSTDRQGGNGDRAGRDHRLGVWRHEHRAGGDGRDLHRQRQCQCRRHPDGSAARVAAMASGAKPRSHRRPSTLRNTAEHYFSCSSRGRQGTVRRAVRMVESACDHQESGYCSNGLSTGPPRAKGRRTRQALGGADQSLTGKPSARAALTSQRSCTPCRVS